MFQPVGWYRVPRPGGRNREDCYYLDEETETGLKKDMIRDWRIDQTGRKKDVISDWRDVPSFVNSADDCLTFRSQRLRVADGPSKSLERERWQ